jgi:ribosomal protein S6E (S10)
VVKLPRLVATVKLTGGDDKAGIPTRSTLRHASGLEQQNFLFGMQPGQSSRAGKTG